MIIAKVNINIRIEQINSNIRIDIWKDYSKIYI